jgi:hypothetical protein
MASSSWSTWSVVSLLLFSFLQIFACLSLFMLTAARGPLNFCPPWADLRSCEPANRHRAFHQALSWFCCILSLRKLGHRDFLAAAVFLFCSFLTWESRPEQQKCVGLRFVSFFSAACRLRPPVERIGRNWFCFASCFWSFTVRICSRGEPARLNALARLNAPRRLLSCSKPSWPCSRSSLRWRSCAQPNRSHRSQLVLQFWSFVTGVLVVSISRSLCGLLQVVIRYWSWVTGPKDSRFPTPNYTLTMNSRTRTPIVWWNGCKDINCFSSRFLSSISHVFLLALIHVSVVVLNPVSRAYSLSIAMRYWSS